MITISRRSLHYRIMQALLWPSLWHKAEPHTLCQYAWALVLCPLAAPVTMGGFLLVAAAFIAAAAAPLWVPAVVWGQAVEPPELILLIGFAALGGLLDLTLLRIAASWLRRRFGIEVGRPAALDTLGVAAEYARARKDKLCPLIRYQD